jgi:hypothetical protein
MSLLPEFSYLENPERPGTVSLGGSTYLIPTAESSPDQLNAFLSVLGRHNIQQGADGVYRTASPVTGLVSQDLYSGDTFTGTGQEALDLRNNLLTGDYSDDLQALSS